MFTQTTTTVSLPDVSPYIIDDGIQSFTASTAALYKNTSIKYPQSISDETTSTISRLSKQKPNGLTTRVITPIAVKYLIDHQSQKKIKINIDTIINRDRKRKEDVDLGNANPFRTATV